jgi:parallel beta-helix repeat protein
MTLPLRLLPTALLLAAPLFALNVGGVLSAPTVWGPSDNPIIVSSHIEVPETLSLTLKPGTIVRFDGYYHLLVKGILDAQGNADNEIEFTSNMEKPAAEDWEGLIFYGEKSQGTLSHCRIRFAFKNFFWKTSPTIQACYFSANNYALYLSYSKSAKLLGNQIVKNSFGVYCDFSSPIIQKNKISGNVYGIYCVLSSAPVVGENEIVSNTQKDIYADESMGKNQTENVNNHVWELMKGLF